MVCFVWTGGVTYGAFHLIDRLVGNRVSERDEISGLDVPEVGVQGYAAEDAAPQ